MKSSNAQKTKNRSNSKYLIINYKGMQQWSIWPSVSLLFSRHSDEQCCLLSQWCSGSHLRIRHVMREIIITDATLDGNSFFILDSCLCSVNFSIAFLGSAANFLDLLLLLCCIQVEIGSLFQYFRQCLQFRCHTARAVSSLVFLPCCSYQLKAQRLKWKSLKRCYCEDTVE